MAVYIVRPAAGRHRRQSVRDRAATWLAHQRRHLGEAWADTTIDAGKDAGLATWFSDPENARH